MKLIGRETCQQRVSSGSLRWTNFLRKISLSTVRLASGYLVNAFHCWPCPLHRPRYAPHHWIFPPLLRKRSARSQLFPKGVLSNLCLRMESIVFPISGFPQTALHPRIVATYFPADFSPSGRTRERSKSIVEQTEFESDGLLQRVAIIQICPAAFRRSNSVREKFSMPVSRVEQ